jgi:hypothetical protein
MLVKSVLIFLLAMALVGMIGKAVVGKKGAKKIRAGVVKAVRCPQCGQWKFGRSGCECGR